ncbi:hypothetical protein BJY01DRAFT_212867 [Aspergillus pseudoustus]|uniref:Uncharacterized protein n=1 Tax=Aspergillus pseudoustus TaxID=1810923 RepID=A0ABR4K6M9_9EURO
MFARPFALRALERSCPNLAPPSGFYTSTPTWRFFSSSIARTKAATKLKQPQNQILSQTPKSSATTQPKIASQAEETLKFAGRRPQGFAKLERKVAKEGELVLFKAPSQRSYLLGAYGLTAFCFAYSIYNSNLVFRDPVIVMPMWQQGLAGGICVMMSVMGTVFLSKTLRLIKTVKGVTLNGQTYIRFSIRRMIPFRKPYEVDVLPGQIAFTRRLVVSPEAMRGERVSLHMESPGPSSMSIMKAPLKAMSKLLWRFFRAIRQIFTSEDFILLEIQGQKGTFRLDSGGYVSPDFLVIGNPLAVKR